MKTLLLVLLSFLFASEIKATNLLCSNKALEALPTQADGRVKPLAVLAKESLSLMTESSHPSSTQLFCELSLQKNNANSELMIPVHHEKIKELLSIPQSQKTINIQKLFDQKSEVSFEYRKQKENNAYKKSLGKLLQILSLFDKIHEGMLWTYFKNNTWNPISDLKNQNDDSINLELSNSQKNFDLVDPKNSYHLEYLYLNLNIFGWLIIVVIFSLGLVTIAKNNFTLKLILLLIILIECVGIAMRIKISGRAPITNMYETVMFSGFGALIISYILYLFSPKKLYLIAGLIFNLLSLLMLKFAQGMLDPSIKPLVPVLRDNFWLSTHVTTVILSYAAFALSWILANLILVQSIKGKISTKDYNEKVTLVYNCLKFGVCLLSAGVILGGVWADYSWGRFWGWDPKETWSLIVLLVYLAILHGKYSSWIPPKRFIPFVAGAFLTVMMAWFGVNYILASGLHSYGFSEGGAIFLGCFFIVQVSFLIFVSIKLKMSDLKV